MNKALPILSITFFLFLVSCEAEYPTSLESSPKNIAIEASGNATMVSQKHGDYIQGEYILMYKKNLPYFAKLDQESAINRTANTRASNAETSELMEKRANAIQSYLESTLAEYQLPAQSVLSIYDIGRSKGGLISMSAEDAQELGKDKRIAIIEPNEIIALNLNPGSKGRLIPADDGPTTQWTTYNISMVGGHRDHTTASSWAYIIDSGIDLDHSDLNVETTYARNFVPYENDADDGFGHGTHVAGIIGAKDNGIGIVGVASGASLVPVKVLDQNGFGTKDYLLKALAYVKANAVRGDVVNISLGTDHSDAVNLAIENIKLKNKVHFAIAAGNQGADTSPYSPANIIDANISVVGSLSFWSYLSGFSNYGKSVGYIAPGEGIYSTYKNGQYAWMSGTSMAAPHVAGVLLVGNGQYNIEFEVKLPTGNGAKLIKHKF